MTDLPLLVSAEAKADIASVAEEYGEVASELEEAFRYAIDTCFEAIRQRPLSYPIIYKTHRRAMLRKFPYFILFTVFDETVVVFGCFHMRRDPAAWKSRV